MDHVDKYGVKNFNYIVISLLPEYVVSKLLLAMLKW